VKIKHFFNKVKEFGFGEDEQFEKLPDLANQINRFLADPAVHAALKPENRYCISANDAQFMLIENFAKYEKIFRKQDFTPDIADILLTRVRTTGVVQEEFYVGLEKCLINLPGGARNERKKWIHCFENVTHILYFIAISDYDRMCWEDEQTPRLDEALSLWESIGTSKYFQDTRFTIVFSKQDLFQKKLEAGYFERLKANYGIDTLASPQEIEIALIKVLKSDILRRTSNDHKANVSFYGPVSLLEKEVAQMLLSNCLKQKNREIARLGILFS
jgi:hypothetical protein